MALKNTLLHRFSGLFGIALLIAPAQAEDVKTLPEGSRRLSVEGVKQIYTDKTWVWGTGGAYFAPDRTFTALSGKDKTLMVAKGRWIVTSDGGLCFIADWRERKRTYKSKKSCFFHAAMSGRIYQSKDASGSWYVFRNRPAQPADEFAKLQAGNTIGDAYAAAVAELK